MRVSVTVTQYLSQQVYVVGEVRAPGPQSLRHASTLLEILVKAGGPTAEAGWEVVVVRAAEAPGRPLAPRRAPGRVIRPSAWTWRS
jgi:protein involved in polysaccharide export with SLBB domain